MSVTQDYKLVTLSGREAFAVARALRSRIDSMTALQSEAITVNVAGLAQYSGEQVRDAKSALAVMIDTPLRAMPVRGSALAGEVQDVYVAKYIAKRPQCKECDAGYTCSDCLGAATFPAPKRVQFDPAELDLVRASLADVVARCDGVMLDYPCNTPENDEASAQRRLALCAIAKVQAA